MATSFTDASGKTWELRLTIGLLPKLREAGFTVGDLGGPNGWQALDDPEQLGRVLWLMVQPQAEKSGVTPEGFADGFDGPAIFAATDALMGAVADFTRPPTVAAALKTRLPAVREKAAARMAARLLAEPIPDLPDPPTPSPSTASAGSSPASPASTPPAAPSAS